METDATEREALLEETVRGLDNRCVQLVQRNLVLTRRVAQLESALRDVGRTVVGATGPVAIEGTSRDVGRLVVAARSPELTALEASRLDVEVP